MSNAVTNHDLAVLHERFEPILCALETHGRIYFNYMKCPHRKADAIQEMRSLGWRWFVRIIETGKNPEDFLVTFCRLLGRSVKSGRRLVGMEKAKDAMSRLTHRRHGFTVQSLPQYETGVEGNMVIDALRDNTITPPPEQAAFRCDFPVWLRTWSERDRSLIHDMMLGERTLDLADKYGLTAGRISQKRQQYMIDWRQFCGEAGDKEQTSPNAC